MAPAGQLRHARAATHPDHEYMLVLIFEKTHIFDVQDVDAAIATVLGHPGQSAVVVRDVEKVHLCRVEQDLVGAGPSASHPAKLAAA